MNAYKSSKLFVLMSAVIAFAVMAMPVLAVEPIFVDKDQFRGQPECVDLAGAYGFNFEYELKLESENLTPGQETAYGVITITWTDGKTFNWSIASGYVMNAIFVKGGQDGHLYIYNSGATSDTGLVSPLNNGGNVPNISHINFCYSRVPQQVCYAGETAWAEGTRYRNPGNWATYTTYSAGGSATIYAGQHYNVGTATFSAVDGNGNVTITINLTGGAKLADGSETVKIQGYNAAPPNQNPAPGQFTTYKGTSLTVTVPAATFYGIHLDVLRVVPCA